MKAIVFRGVGDIRLEEASDPQIQQPTDAIVRLTASAICGTDLHLIRGTVTGMQPGTIIGHEGVGVVEQVGSAVRNLKEGDRVVIPSTIGCGSCAYCRQGYYAQCDTANPNGPLAGTACFGGPKESGPFNGLQAERARIPFASAGPVKLPDDVSDDQAILLSDIFPTAYFGAKLAEIQPGNVVAVFGCGPVGLLSILSAWCQGAGRVLAVDAVPSRLEMARTLGAEVINYETDDPVETIRALTGGIGADRVIDAVGVDANCPDHPQGNGQKRKLFEQEVRQVAPQTNPQGDNWHPGDAPSQALMWATQAVDKAGTISIIGVYPQSLQLFPLGEAMNKNLTIKTGNCNHRKYIPTLLEQVRSGAVDLTKFITQRMSLEQALDAYRSFDRRQPGWIKVELLTPAAARR